LFSFPVNAYVAESDDDVKVIENRDALGQVLVIAWMLLQRLVMLRPARRQA